MKRIGILTAGGDTPGYASAVFVPATGVDRIRTTAESHRRIRFLQPAAV
jgi:6-phosphofructokinase